jgi:hypothetical protein
MVVIGITDHIGTLGTLGIIQTITIGIAGIIGTGIIIGAVLILITITITHAIIQMGIETDLT